MKKLLSVLLVMAVVMSFATVMSVSADEKEDLVAAGASQDVETAAADGNVSVGAGTDTETTGTSGKVYFEKPKWAGTVFYAHIFETDSGTSFWGWQLKKEKLEDLNKIEEIFKQCWQLNYSPLSFEGWTNNRFIEENIKQIFQ